MKTKQRKQIHFILSSIALMLLLGFLWLYTETDEPPSFDKKQTRKEPEFFMSGMRTQQFDEKGQLENSIASIKVKSFAKGIRTELKSPIIQLYEDNQPSWKITANSGTVRNQGKKVDLINDVLIINQDQQYRLLTSALTIYPQQHLAENNKAVTIITPQGKTHAIGIKADLKNERTILKQNVTGKYHAIP